MKKFLVGLLSVLLVMLLVGNTLYLAIAESISKDSIKSSIKDNLLTGFIYDEEGNKTEIFQTLLRLTTLDEETIIKLMENETMNEILTEGVNSIYDYNLTGDASYKYSREKIISIVEDNIDQVMREIDYNLTPRNRQEVLDYVRENTDYIIDTIYSVDIGDYRP